MSRGDRAADDPNEVSSRADDGLDPAGDDRAVQDISAVRRDEDVVAALAARRALDTVAASDVSAAADDDAIRLLRALIADVDADAPPLPVAAGTDRTGQAKPRRRRARVIVSLSVTAMVLTTTGVAAAGGGLGGVVSRWMAPAQDTSYRESRAELRRAEEAVEHKQYDAARSSLDSARHRRRALHGPQGKAVDKEIGRLESRLPRTPSTQLPRPWAVPPTPKPGDLQRTARSKAEKRLDDIRKQWPAQGR